MQSGEGGRATLDFEHVTCLDGSVTVFCDKSTPKKLDEIPIDTECLVHTFGKEKIEEKGGVNEQIIKSRKGGLSLVFSCGAAFLLD